MSCRLMLIRTCCLVRLGTLVVGVAAGCGVKAHVWHQGVASRADPTSYMQILTKYQYMFEGVRPLRFGPRFTLLLR
jgi:hypothetical protein